MGGQEGGRGRTTKEDLEEAMQHLSELVHGGPTGGLVEQAHLLTKHRLRSSIALQGLLDPTLDHHRLLIPQTALRGNRGRGTTGILSIVWINQIGRAHV